MVRVVAVALAFAFLALAGCVESEEPGLEPEADKVVTPAPVVNETVEQPSPAWPHYPNDGASEAIDIELPAFDDSPITATIHKPAIASNETRFPVLLHSHGFTGARSAAQDAFQDHIAAGFAVISFDERGHGDRKDSTVEFMQPDVEVLDVIAIIDHLATLDWVLMDGPGDPRIGAIGGSYGGAFQTMTAVFDDRLDVLVPEITWNNIADALAPNGVINSVWVDLFYVAGNTISPITFNDDFHAGFAWATATNELPAGQVPGVVPDLVKEFNEASPSSYPGAIDKPTLLIQGMTDSLFPLGQAVSNYGLIGETGAPVALYTHRGGHLAPGGVQYVGPVQAGFQAEAGPSACGDLTELQIAWHLEYLLEVPSWGRPSVCLSLQDGSDLTADAFPLPNTTWAPTSAGTIAVPQLPVGALVDLPLMTLDVDAAVAGIPRLAGTVTSPADGIAFFALKATLPDGSWFKLDDQVMPMRWKDSPVGEDFEIDLKGVAVALPAGTSLSLSVGNWDPLFFGNAGRVPGAVVLEDLTVTLPIVEV